MNIAAFRYKLRTPVRHLRSWVIVGVTLYVVIQLLVGLTGWGKIGSALPPGHSASVQVRAKLHAQYTEAKKHSDPVVQARVETVASIACGLIGELCDDDLAKSTDKSSLLHKAANFIALPYSAPPASGVAWLGDTFEHVGFVPKSYAEGMGFSALGAYQRVWKIMRDVSFMIITIIILVSGFMVIFQAPIGEKASAKVSEVLPRLVIVLVMISLSYAICGLLIDMMYVAIFMAFSVMAPLLDLDPVAQNQAFVSLASGQPMNLMNLIMSDEFAPAHLFNLGQSLFRLMPVVGQVLVSTIVFQVGLPFLGAAIGSLMPAGATQIFLKTRLFGGNLIIQMANKLTEGGILKSVSQNNQTPAIDFALTLVLAMFQAVETFAFPVITPLVIATLIALTGIYLVGKVWFMLFYAYVEIVTGVIFAPIFIMLHAIPGSKTMVAWIKNLCINLMIFPAVVVLVMVSAYISNANNGGGYGLNFWAPPFLNSIGDQSSLQILIGGLIFYNIPYYIDKMKKALGHEESERPGVSTLFHPIIGLTQSAGSTIQGAAKFGHDVGGAGLFKKILGLP